MNYRLCDLGRVITGTTPSTKNTAYIGQDHQFVCPADMKGPKYVKNTEKKISQKAKDDYNTRFVDKNSVMVDCIGSDMGNAAITTGLCLTNQQINTLTDIDTKKANVEFLYYKLSTMKKFFHQIGLNGSTMPIINKTQFEQIEVELPEIGYQNKAAKLLSGLDRLIDTNNRTNDNLHHILYCPAFIR